MTSTEGSRTESAPGDAASEALEAIIFDLERLLAGGADGHAATDAPALTRPELEALLHRARGMVAGRTCEGPGAGRGTLDAEVEEAQAQAQRIASLERQLGEQLRYRQRLNSRLSHSKRDLAAARTELAVLRGSFAFRLGSILIDAARSPRGFVALPVRFFRLFRQAWPRVHARMLRAVGMGGSDDRPDLGPDVPLHGRDAEWASTADAAPIKRMLHGTDTAPALPDDVGELRIATVMDEFSFNAYRACGNLQQLSADDWQAEMEELRPHLLIVESAWKGKDESWARKVYPLSRQLLELVEWCRSRRIPTAFWNKEDPVHLSVFMRTARQFDFVFTTDVDCIRAYKNALGHDQVYWLPFACQPVEHNPLEGHVRKDGFSFAGSFYAKYPDRQRDFAMLVDAASAFRPVDIFDRNAGSDDPALAYPERYQAMIRGSLPHERIAEAYKGYRYGININTVKQSQSMFARRVFDLLGCNTVTISNFSRGLRMMFGDTVISSDDGAQVRRRLQPLVDDDARYRRFRLAGLRKVLSEHTYQHRLRYVVEKVGGKPLEEDAPSVLVLARADERAQLDHLLASFLRQSHRRKAMRVLVPDTLSAVDVPAGVALYTSADWLGMTGVPGSGDRWHARFDPRDYYGDNYLADLCLATRYSTRGAVGKRAYHVATAEGGLALREGELAYRDAQSVDLRRGIARHERMPLRTLLEAIASGQPLVVEDGVSVDEFNYCEGGAGVDCTAVSDIEGLWTGLPIEAIQSLAETVEASGGAHGPQHSAPALDAEALSQLLPMGDGVNPAVSLRREADGLRLDSRLLGDEHVYLYAPKPVDIGVLFSSDIGKFNLLVDTEMLLSIVFIYLDAEKQRIGHAIRACSSNLSMSPPAGARYVRTGLRVQGPGTALIRKMVLGHVPPPVAGIPGRSRTLLVSRGYPSYRHLYSYAYVHRRMMGYAAEGVGVDVFRITDDALAFDEFEGVDVVSGRLSDLELMVASNDHETILVHSLDRALWSVLAECAPTTRVIVWVHGAEIQPWFRRDFSFLDERDRERGMQRSHDRMAFWRDFVASWPANVELVFVSEHLLKEAERDLAVSFDRARCNVIHNFIDGAFFEYVQKAGAQRRRLLSIRPYARPTYANDIVVKAILDLREEAWFKDLQFHLVGDGALFDETVAPVRDLPNVIVEKRFLTQSEIVALHRENGVLLSPSRIDSQGVSRDEAMASGLVPVVSRVSAVPEFVDETCAMLTAPEDWRGVADAVRRLQGDEALFHSLSRSAADRVRRQSARESTLLRELALIRGEADVGRRPLVRPTRRIAFFADLDMNLIDGSAIWAASIVEVISGADDVHVDVFLKHPIRNTRVLKGLLGRVNVSLLEPEQEVPDDAATALQRIARLDARRAYGAILIRGFQAATGIAGTPALGSRLWAYLTDIPQHADDMTPEHRAALGKIAEVARVLLCQTPQIEEFLNRALPASIGKTRLLPPMVPDTPTRSPETGSRPDDGVLRVVYAGKFAPAWGIRELFGVFDRLRQEGVPIELHIYGDKIHNPPDDPAFKPFVRNRLESANGVVWHRGLDRAGVLAGVCDADLGWAWRHASLESTTLELSTKVLEYAACGVAPIVARGPVNEAALGADYPLFATGEDLGDTLRGIACDKRLLGPARARLAALARRFTFDAVRAENVGPLLDEVLGPPAAGREPAA